MTNNTASTPFRWGIIGTGNIANVVAKEIVTSGRHVICAVYSRTYAKASKFSTKFGAKCYDELEKFLSDPDIDGVYIASPHSAHYSNMKKCIQFKKPVLCEKAFTVNAAQTQALTDYAKQQNVFIAEGMWTRFLPAVRQAKSWIEEGKIGKVSSVSASFGIPMQLIKPFISDRVYLPKYAGGSLLDLGVYPISLAEFLFGMPDGVNCKMEIKNGIDVDEEIEFLYDGFSASLSSTFKKMLNHTAVIEGSLGKISLPRFSRAKKAILIECGKKIVFNDNSGYIFEFDACANDIKKGLLESSVMPLSKSHDVMMLMDECRKQNNLVYPTEIETL